MWAPENAPFAVAMNGHQVAALVPTTVLAGQHFETFRSRFDAFPVRVALASRSASAVERRHLEEGVATGDVKVIIGTPALLSKQMQFARLGLIIVEEEHRFGVRHKERLK